MSPQGVRSQRSSFLHKGSLQTPFQLLSSSSVNAHGVRKPFQERKKLQAVQKKAKNSAQRTTPLRAAYEQ
jgi:hypothetical protein